MDINFSPPFTRSKNRLDTEVLRDDYMDTSSANISVECVNNSSMTFESPMDILSPVLLQTSSEETLTVCDSKSSKTDQVFQTRTIIHPNSTLDLVDLCDDVWPDENCLKVDCAYSELNAVQSPNSDLYKCEICNIVLCKTCRCSNCHDFHDNKFLKIRDDT